MRQRVDADAEFADLIGLFENLAVDATGVQHQCHGQAANAAADDDDFHGRSAFKIWPFTQPVAAIL
jgi:hypothetical protein